MHPDLKNFVLAFLKDTGLDSEPIELQELSGDGSSRTFWRIFPAQSARNYIAMANPPVNDFLKRENQAYLMIGKHLYAKGIPVPEIYRYNSECGWFIMEDLGKTDLQKLISLKNNPLPDYEKVLEQLTRLQIEGSKGFNPSWCCQTPAYDRLVMRQYESNYFRDAFLKNYLGLDRDWSDLEAPFDYLAMMASGADSGFFLHRDFQSRNIMISDKGHIGFVDWQGGRIGPLGYDLASLIIDPYTELSARQKTSLFQIYTHMIREHNAGWVESFIRSFPYLAIQRNLQILGAFAFLTKERNKPHFEGYITPAKKNLLGILQEVNDPKLSSLKHILGDICN